MDWASPATLWNNWLVQNQVKELTKLQKLVIKNSTVHAYYSGD